MGQEDTLQGTKLTYHTKREKGYHLQKCLGMGYVSSQEGKKKLPLEIIPRNQNTWRLAVLVPIYFHPAVVIRSLDV